MKISTPFFLSAIALLTIAPQYAYYKITSLTKFSVGQCISDIADSESWEQKFAPIYVVEKVGKKAYLLITPEDSEHMSIQSTLKFVETASYEIVPCPESVR